MTINLENLDEETRKKILNLQNVSTSLEYLTQQKLQMETALRECEIAIEELDAELTKIFPGSTQKDKQGRIILCEYLFGTSSKTKIESINLQILVLGIKEIRALRGEKNESLAQILEGEITHDDFLTEQTKESPENSDEKGELIVQIDEIVSQLGFVEVGPILENHKLKLGELKKASVETLEAAIKDLNGLLDSQLEQ